MRSLAAWMIAGWVALAVGGVAEAGTRRISLGSLNTGLTEMQKSVCDLYARTGLSASLPAFCEPAPAGGTCDASIDPGPCRAQIPRWGFDAQTGACERFLWSGCGGNANRFETRAECETACAVVACEQRIEPGPCDAQIARWAFDAEQGACVRFVYGGCSGNANNFETEEACLESCGGQVDVCSLPAEAGPCDAAIPRWYHDAESGHCERFVYGGCGGNANNFATLAECQGACIETPRCEQPVEPGPCRAQLPRWHHDPDTGECERFLYGGCGGNDNNFATQAACEAACPRCDDALCEPHQQCQLFRDPRCLEKQKRCERICGEGCDERCDPVPFCADTCDRAACPAGTRCELIEVQCVSEPCPPVRQCVPVADPCEDVVCAAFQQCETDAAGAPYCFDVCAEGACPAGTRCVLQEVQCATEPCPPVRRCEQPPNPCAQVNCRPGTRCVVNRVGQPICTID